MAPSQRGQMDSSAQDLQTNCIASIIENRAKEVGMAILDKNKMQLLLLQLVETSRSYIHTVDLLSAYHPSTLIVVASGSSGCQASLNAALRDFQQVAMPRASFDDTKAALGLEQLASTDSRPHVDSLRQSSYLALGASGALLKFLEEEESMVMASGSLSIRMLALEHNMQISAATVQALELVEPLSQATLQGSKNSCLFQWLNKTRTKLGARLLRANILQPLTDVVTIAMRQDALQELLTNEQLALDAAQGLSQLPPDLDKLCASLAMNPKPSANVGRKIGHMIQALILLRDCLAALPLLSQGLAPAATQLMTAMRQNYQHEGFGEVLRAISDVLDVDAHAHKQVFLNRTQQCFAVNSGCDGLLDVARATFCRITEQVHALIASYQEEVHDVAMKAKYTDKRGFHLELPDTGIEHLPRGFFVLHSKSRKGVLCTTPEMDALNTRLQSAHSNCMILTMQVLDSLRMKILRQLPLLHKLADNLALLDMLSALADSVREGGPDAGFVRPRCTAAGPIAIVEGRHPLLERMQGVHFQANDTYLSDCSSLYVIGGPNMSGKSTYLRQVALITILAQIGCYVPATFASVRCVDRLFARMGTGDSIERNSSTFMMEMQETAYVLDCATPNSLILIDELGRATSTADGVGIAWAVAEHLIALGAATLFASHFPQLGELASLYPTCKLWHFDVATTDRLDFKWRLLPGRGAEMHYGLLLAPLVGIPEAVLDEARRIAQAVKDSEAYGASLRTTSKHQQLEAVYSLAHRITCVSRARENPPQDFDVCKQLAELQREAKRVFPAGKGERSALIEDASLCL